MDFLDKIGFTAAPARRAPPHDEPAPSRDVAGVVGNAIGTAIANAVGVVAGLLYWPLVIAIGLSCVVGAAFAFRAFVRWVIY